MIITVNEFKNELNKNILKLSPAEILKIKKEFEYFLNSYYQSNVKKGKFNFKSDGVDKGLIYHFTSDKNIDLILKNGFNTKYTFFNMFREQYCSYGSTAIVIDYRDFKNNIYPDPEVINSDNEIWNKIDDIIDEYDKYDNSKSLAERIDLLNIDLNLLTKVWLDPDSSCMTYCFIKGIIPKSSIKGTYTLPKNLQDPYKNWV